jgi:serine palmitoyltransferase
MGGYIASSREVIDFIKSHAAGMLYHNALSPVVSQQILTAFKVITGQDGTTVGRQKIERLKANSNYFRSEMVRLGLHVYGDYDSPIIPVLIYLPGKVRNVTSCHIMSRHVTSHYFFNAIFIGFYFIFKLNQVAAFSRECLKRGLAVVVVGFPATTVILSRARFCISAGHTKEDLDFAVKVLDEVSSLLLLKYSKNFLGSG